MPYKLNPFTGRLDYFAGPAVPSGGGDMLKAVYDPANGLKQVAFSDQIIVPSSTELGQFLLGDGSGGWFPESVDNLVFDSATGKLTITQLELLYDDDNKTIVETNSSGEYYITPTSGIVNIYGEISKLNFLSTKSFGHTYEFHNDGLSFNIKGPGGIKFLNSLDDSVWSVSTNNIIPNHSVKGTLLVSRANAAFTTIQSVAEFEGIIDQLVLSYGQNGGGSTLKTQFKVDPSGNGNITPSGGGLSITATLDAQSLQITSNITPPSLSAQTDNWDPDDLLTCRRIRISATGGNQNITGIRAIPNRVIIITNAVISGPNVVLLNENVASSPSNRFALFANITIQPTESVTIMHDEGLDRWLVISKGI